MKLFKRLFFSLVFMLALLSCSVKEDRGGCPCYLILVPNEGRKMAENGGFTVQVYDSRYTVEVLDSIPWKSLASRNYETPIVRGSKTVCCISGFSRQFLEGEHLLIPFGHQADSVFACSEELMADRETVSSKVLTYKQYTNVFLKYKESGKEEFPYEFVIKGNVCGMNIRTLRPLKGPFEYCPGTADSYDISRFRLPRQNDNSLTLCIVSKVDGKEIDVFNLGEAIEESGFDWSSPDLDDIYISLDKYPNSITVSVLGWENAGTYEEMI